MSDNEPTEPTTGDQLPPTAAEEKAQREHQEMLDYIRWGGEGGNNLD